jgi:hypothetical protein
MNGMRERCLGKDKVQKEENERERAGIKNDTHTHTHTHTHTNTVLYLNILQMLVLLHVLLLFPFEDIFILLPYRTNGVLDSLLLVLLFM